MARKAAKEKRNKPLMLANLLVFSLLRKPQNNADLIHRGYALYYWRQCRTVFHKLRVLIYFILSPVVILRETNVWISKAGVFVSKCGYKNVLRQYKDIFLLSYFFSIDAENYYLQEFYKEDGIKRAKQFVNLKALKHGVYNVLNKYGRQINHNIEPCSMGSKVEFLEFCKMNQIPTVDILMEFKSDNTSKSYSKNISANTLPDCNIFCKPNVDNEGKFAEVWFWLGDNLYKNTDGISLSTLLLRKRLFELAKNHRCGSFIVQPLMTPHKSLSVFRKLATPTIRVITYIEPDRDQIKIDSAMFRFSWKNESIVDNASAGGLVAPINLKKGTLGPASGSDIEFITARWSYLPESDIPIDGFKMPYWAETLSLAMKTHQLFPYRLIVGWDFIITDEGPLILEGNSQPGLCFIQKAHLKPFGEMKVGFAISRYLELAERCFYSGTFSKKYFTQKGFIDFYGQSKLKRMLSILLIKNIKTIKLNVIGKFNGKCYQSWLQRQAVSRKLNGWVCTLPDESIEIVIRGRAVDVEDIVWLSRIGPERIIVDNIVLSEYRSTVNRGFIIKGNSFMEGQ